MATTKLIQLGKYYYPVHGGMETHLYHLCRQFRDRYDIEVLVANTRARTVSEVIDGTKVTRLANLGELFSNPICPTFPYHLSKIDCRQDTIIQLHLPNPMAHLAYLLARPSGRLIIMWHSDIVRQELLGSLYESHLLRLLDRADCIIATSPNYVKYSSYLNPHSSKCVVVPLGIEPQGFEGTPAVLSLANSIRKRHGNRILLFVGRLAYYKGLDTLLQATKEIDAAILMVGKGPLRNKVAGWIRTNALEQKVYLYENISNHDLAAFYHACDVFVLPSNQRSEAFGLVQLEAMVCGKPTISTNLTTGVPWVNQHGKTGLIVPVNDAGRLAAAVNRLLDNEEEKRYLGANAKRRVLDNFTITKVCKETQRVYEGVLNGGVQSNLADINY